MPDKAPSDAQVLHFAAQGYTAHDIAQRLGVEDAAVHNAVARIKRRLKARDLHHAVQIHQTRKETPDA